MRPLPAADICRAVGGTFLQSGGGTVTGVTSDSRQIASGDYIDPQQQGYGEKHYRLECDAAQPGHGTMMNLPFVGKVE